MSIEKKPDHKTKVSSDTELTDQDLGNVTGGDGLLDGIKGESADARHKDTVHIESFRKP